MEPDVTSQPPGVERELVTAGQEQVDPRGVLEID